MSASGTLPFLHPLRVLVVDDDSPCLMIVQQMLRRCHYEGNTLLQICYLLSLSWWTPSSQSQHVQMGRMHCLYLKTKQSPNTTWFSPMSWCRVSCSDFGISNGDLLLPYVASPGMDGFRLLELIGLELDLPVISKWRRMMQWSENGEVVIFLIHPPHSDVLERWDKYCLARRHARGGRFFNQASALGGASEPVATRCPT